MHAVKSEAQQLIRDLTAFYEQQPNKRLFDQLHLLLDDESWTELEVTKIWLKEFQQQSVTSLAVCYSHNVSPYLMKGDKIHVQSVSLLRFYQLMLHQLTTQENTQIQQVPKSILTMIEQLIGDVFSITRSQCDLGSDTNQDLLSAALSSQLKIIGIILEAYSIDRHTLTGIATLLLSFSQPQPSSHLLLPSLKQINVFEHCSIPMTPALACVIAIENVEISRFRWWDSMANKAVSFCWQSLILRMNCNIEKVNNIPQEACKSLGWDNVAKAIRQQFFEKKEKKVEVSENSLPTYPLKITKDLQQDPLYRMEQCRIRAVLNFVHLLGTETEEVIPNLLPICFALIDSFPPKLVALGSTALVVLLDISPKDLFQDFEDAMVSVLKKALKTTADRVALTYICLACTKLVKVFPDRVKDRRYFTITLIQMMQGKLLRLSEESCTFLGIMLSGLGPLLAQQAKQNDAELIEISRPALRVLLPLLREGVEESGKKLQIVVLIGIINLTVGGYPIMAHHSNKIICELLACWGHSNNALPACKGNERELCLKVLSLSTHATAVALLFCGKRAHEIMEITSFNSEMALHLERVKEKHQMLLTNIENIL
mmetsp:Transcript_6105/g.9368  ORF Transcript_6105/g.9368 Transcript_6105/m.9368 type:complete len:599 (+) Transcript_6105:101-1897(+)